MVRYVVGQRVSQFIGHPESVIFDIDDAGGAAFVFFRSPTEEEIEQFKAGTKFEMRFVSLGTVIMLLFKIGELNWMDAPYSPKLSKLTTLLMPAESQGLGVTIFLVDTCSGEIMASRLVGLSTNFTKELYAEINEQLKKPFNEQNYDREIQSIYSRYSTLSLVKMSSHYCKVN